MYVAQETGKDPRIDLVEQSNHPKFRPDVKVALCQVQVGRGR